MKSEAQDRIMIKEKIRSKLDYISKVYDFRFFRIQEMEYYKDYADELSVDDFFDFSDVHYEGYKAVEYLQKFLIDEFDDYTLKMLNNCLDYTIKE